MKAFVIAVALVAISAVIGAYQSTIGGEDAGIIGSVHFVVPTVASIVVGALMFTIFRLIFGCGWIVRTVSCILSAFAVVAALFYIAGEMAGPHPTDGTSLSLLYMLLLSAPPLATVAGLFGAGICRKA